MLLKKTNLAHFFVASLVYSRASRVLHLSRKSHLHHHYALYLNLIFLDANINDRDMLPKSQKLTRTTFPKYTDPKKNWTGDFLRIQYTFTKSLRNPLFAVVISKKIHASAVKRNKLRREIFTMIENKQSTLSIKKGVKFVFFPLKKNGVINIESINKDIQSFLTQLS